MINYCVGLILIVKKSSIEFVDCISYVSSARHASASMALFLVLLDIFAY